MSEDSNYIYCKRSVDLNISQYINQINEKPVLFEWRYKMEERDVMPGGITI
jgi:hypothetical protein